MPYLAINTGGVAFEMGILYKALRSAGGFRRLHTHSQGIFEATANEGDRVVHDFRCKLTTCKCYDMLALGSRRLCLLACDVAL